MRVARRGSLAWIARRMRREASILGVSVKVGRRGGEGRRKGGGRRGEAEGLHLEGGDAASGHSLEGACRRGPEGPRPAGDRGK